MYEIYDWELIEKEANEYWEITELEKKEMFQQLVRTATFARCFNPRYNLTDFFWRYIKAKTSGQDHVIIVLLGRTGSGKSRVAQVIGKVIDKNLWVDNIVFTNEELLSRAEKIKRNSVIIQDEQVVLMGVGSEREKAEIANIEMVMRKFGLSLIFCSPVEFPHETAHLKLEVICKSKKHRKTKLGVLDKKNNYLGYVVIDIPEDKDDKLWITYDSANIGKKDKFIEDLKKRQLSRLDFKDRASKIKNHELYKKYKGKVNDKTLNYIIREQNPQLADKEVNLIFTAFYNYYAMTKQKKLTMDEIRSDCNHKETRYSKKDQAITCRKCGHIVARDN